MNFNKAYGRKLISAIMICVMFLPMCLMQCVVSASEPVNHSALYADDFSDGVLSSNISTRRFYTGDPADTISETGGKLVFERKKWIWYTDAECGEPMVEIYANADHTPVRGDILAKFTLSKTREVVRVRFCDEDGNYLTQLSWEGNSLVYRWRNIDNTSESKSIATIEGEEVTVALRSNITSKRPTFSLWINDELCVDEMYSATDISKINFSKIQIYTLLYASYSKAGTFSVDNVSISRVSDVPAVEKILIENTFDSSASANLLETDLTGGGSVGVSGGVLSISKTGEGTSKVGADIYIGGTKLNQATGIIGLEYDIKRQNSNTVQIRSMDSAGNLYYSFSWSRGGINASYSDDKSAPGTFHDVWSASTDSMHVNMMFDTSNSSYWLWIDGQLIVEEKYSRAVGVGALCYTMFYLESKNTVEIDNYKVYEAIPPKALRLRFDAEIFEEESAFAKVCADGGCISESVVLPNKLRYGTSVSWQSSHPDIINPANGEVTRPINDVQNPLVTLTATFENSGITKIKQYSCYVLRKISDDADPREQDINDINTSMLTGENPNSIRMSLRLPNKGLFGSDIRWTSSDTSVITTSGRVIRPRFDESDAKVTLTASSGPYSKELSFTVVADEPPKDPMHTTDEEFFGVWDGSTFSVVPQLDYNIAGLSNVESCVKNGNYAGAREALYEYFKTRKVPSPIGLGTRHTGWVDARADGVFELSEEAAYWKGQMTITSDEYEPVTSTLYKPSSIVKSRCKTFELLARYNEATSAYVLGTGAENDAYVPTLELTVNGTTRTYKATNTATIRAGSFAHVPNSNTKELEAIMFGDFLGNETTRILIAFDLSDISSSDNITSAKLTVYAKKSSPSADNKELWIMDNKGGEWDEDTVFWDSLNFNLHNYNGLIGGTDWKGVRSSDVEFYYQMPRFMHARNTMAEYKATSDEKYAYSLLGQVMDIIVDTGDKTPYPRSLDSAARMQNLVPLMNTFAHSKYLTSDFCVAFMKYMYDQFEYFPTRGNATGNWREYEQLALLYATSAYPELINSSSARDACILSWKNALSKSFMTDGSYIEDTGGYHRSSFAMYRDFKKACISSGVELPEEFDSLLHKGAYYMVLTRGAGGLSLQYGDEGAYKQSGNSYTDISEWYDDDTLRYIDSFGQSGTQPIWTSYQFPEGRYTMMRSDWTSDAIYLHTNVRGGGGHGHADDNSIILMAGNRRLLVDAGKFTYNSYDPSRIYGLSTRGHNTVVINNTSQRMGWTGSEFTVRGDINKWVTNPEYDFLSQTSIAYADHDHTRNILFLKEGLFVVSDRMTPHDLSSENNYRQYWHMMPEAGIKISADGKSLSSSYGDGKNLIITSTDEVNTFLEDGYYDMGDGTTVTNKAGIFEKNNVGVTGFDTVMYVSSHPDAKVTTSHLDTSSTEEGTSALKINVTENDTSKTHYYIFNPLSDGTSPATFGSYSTNAKIALVSEDENGNITAAVMNDGAYIRKNDSTVIDTAGLAGDLSVIFDKGIISVASSDTSVSSSDITIAAFDDIEALSYNGAYMDFMVSDGKVVIGCVEEGGVRTDLYDVCQGIVADKTVTSSDGTVYLIGNLDLSRKTGKSGSIITYEVSDVSLISEDGTVTRAQYDKPVTINVTSSKNNTSVSSEIHYMIPGKYNRIGRGTMPLASYTHPSLPIITDSNTSGKTDSSQLTSFSQENGKINFSSSYAYNKEPGFTLVHSERLTDRFVWEFNLTSDSRALRMRFADHSWNRKLDIYYFGGTLLFAGSTNEYHPSNFAEKKVKLTLDFSMKTNTVDIYIDGEKWLDDFALVSGGYSNLQIMLVSHHCATIMGQWREGNGTTSFDNMNVYVPIDEANISTIMMGDVVFSNKGVPALGTNVVSVPVVTTDSHGETESGAIVYAIYADTGKASSLVGIDIQKFDLNQFCHEEYTASIYLPSSMTNMSQTVFLIDINGNMRPLETKKME